MVDDIAIDADWSALYINGEQIESESGESIAVEDPSTHETVAHVPRRAETDIDAAYETAAEAQESQAKAPPARRQEVAEQFLQTLNEYGDEIIDLLAHEVDGSYIMGEISVQIASDHASETVTLSHRMRNRHIISNIPGKKSVVQKNPKSVVAVISPWDFPLSLSMWAVAPTVAAGNAVILKSSINSPITGGLPFAKLFEETNLPEGVTNVVTGRDSEIDDHVTGHPESDVVAFTDPTEVGKRVSSIAGENLAVPAMGLGGNNAHVVIEGADVNHVVDAAAFGGFVHQGQVCISINHHVTHESVYDEYVKKLTERAAELPVSSTHEDDTVAGLIIGGPQRDEMLGYVKETVAASTTLETGSSTADLDGVDDSLVVQPTILSDVASDMVMVCNEHFGPIAPVIPLSNVDGVIELANATEYGLSGSVHAGDLVTGKETVLRMETGNVHVNDQPTNGEAYVLFSGIGVSDVGIYNGDAFPDEVTEDRWISLQHEPRGYPL